MIVAALLVCLAPTAYDGDTIKCANGQAIRLFGVQAPETRPVEAGAIESRDYLQASVNGGVVCESRGASFSRIVARCFNAGGADIAKAQLEAGHATEWCSYSRNFYGTC